MFLCHNSQMDYVYDDVSVSLTCLSVKALLPCRILCQQARKKRKMPMTTSPMRMYSKGVSDKSSVMSMLIFNGYGGKGTEFL